MVKGKELNFNFNETPEVSNINDWPKYSVEAENFVSQHAQTGETGYSTFGENVAARALRRFLDSTKRMSHLQEIEAPEILLDHERKIIEKKLDKIGKIKHEEIAELRSTLVKLPVNVRRKQNQIFTSLMNEYESKFILENLRPNRIMRKGADKLDRNFIYALMGLRSEQVMWYDFIGKLTELDEDGKPVVKDESFQNFFEWYQTSLAKWQHKLNADRPANIADYSSCLKKAVSHKLLPESFTENLDFVEPNSPRSRNLNFSLFDMMGRGSSASGLYVKCVLTDREAPIGVRADVVVDNDVHEVIWHELTHAISGDMIDFSNDEANRIVNEALTEHISHMILNSNDDEWDFDEDNGDFDFMSGKAYAKERDVVGWLASSGAKTIPSKTFYEAYAEYDPEYEKIFDKWWTYDMENNEKPKPKIGPKKEALFLALLEAFPDCKNTSDLGKIIVKKFKESPLTI